jgi:hypothetical protein
MPGIASYRRTGPGTRRRGTGPSLVAAAGGISESPKGTCSLWISRYSDLCATRGYSIIAVSNEF